MGQVATQKCASLHSLLSLHLQLQDLKVVFPAADHQSRALAAKQRRNRASWLKSIVVAVLATVAIYLIFGMWLRIPFPGLI